MDFILEELLSLKSRSLYRTLKRTESPPGPRVTVDGNNCLLLSSNNYLGLSGHPEINSAMIAAVKKWGSGSGASRLISGNLPPHEELEKEIASFKGTEAAIVFNTGYMANLGVISALTGEGDLIMSDELNHASIIDGCRLSRAETRVYRHRDMSHLEEILKQSVNYRRRLIVTDGVFSMDGDIAPLPNIVDLAEKYNAIVLVDDAHATGVLGQGGAGTAEYFGLEGKIPIQMGTLSKALGSFGAYVAGQSNLIDFLRNRSRSFIFSTSLPPAVIEATRAALQLIKKDPGIIERLWENARYMRTGLKRIGYQVLSAETHIIPVMIGEESKTLDLACRLMDKGVYAAGIRPPTVPPGTCRIRVTVMSSHTPGDLDQALNAFAEAGRESGIF